MHDWLLATPIDTNKSQAQTISCELTVNKLWLFGYVLNKLGLQYNIFRAIQSHSQSVHLVERL